MKFNKTLLILLAFLLAVTGINAQSSVFDKANKLFEKTHYSSAAEAYEKGLKKEDNVTAKHKLADCHRLLGNFEMAEFWYGRTAANDKADKEAHFQYGKMLMATEKYDDAKKAFATYKQKGGSSSLADKNIGACDFAKKAMVGASQYKITPMPLSTKYNEFGAVPYGEGFLLTSARKRGFWTSVVNMRNKGRFYDIYYVVPSTGKQPYKAKPARGKVNSRFHDGPAIYDAKTGTLYFTRSNYVNGKSKRSKDGVNKLKILTAQKSGTKWVDVKELSFNSNEYSCGHPALSSDGMTMIFSSDIPGGFGGTDLYITRKEGDKWSTPQNLGSEVNTEGNEQFPTIHDSGMLFFSSNGHPGMGGLDIFSTALNGKKYSKPKNLGYPLNSSRDDFSTSWIKNKAKGYFASNRKTSKGGDDIFMFSRKISLNGTIVDSRTKALLENVNVNVLDVNNKKSDYVTGEEGNFSHFVDFGKDYFITVELDDYFPKKLRVSTKEGSPLEDQEVLIEIEREVLFSAFGTVTDAENGLPLQDAKVRVVGLGKESTVPTDNNGKYFSKLDENQEYDLVVTKSGYRPQIVKVMTNGRTGPEDFQRDIKLTKGKSLLVEGTVMDQVSKKRLSKSTVRAIATDKQEEVSTVVTRTDGRFWMSLDPEMDQYLLIGSRAYYFATRLDLPLPAELPEESTQDVTIEMVRYRVGEIAKIIYFDYNKSDIRRDASKELYEMVYFLVDNPEAKVELGSHTDSRGGNSYNQKLSSRRAEAAAAFIVSKGIDKSRITSKGYGEIKLTNKCADGVECKDEEHALNRRSELMIIGIEPIDLEEGTGATDDKKGVRGSGATEAPKGVRGGDTNKTDDKKGVRGSATGDGGLEDRPW